VAPTDEVPIVVASNGARRLVRAKWGFRATWMTDSKLAPINARAENIALNRMFQAAVRDSRCFVRRQRKWEC
jgi:putative SOS response-associated peptidase YedK